MSPAPHSNWFLSRVGFYLAAALMGLLLIGCRAPSQAGQQSSLPVASWFPNDPKARELAVASEFGRIEDIRRLMKIEAVDPNKVFSKDRYPLLVWPVITENPEGLRAMLENGANPNARFPIPRIEVFKDGSYDVSFQDNAMVWAAKAKDPIYLKLLLDHGGDPNTRNANDETLLLQAFLTGNQWENVKLLVERGADVNAKSQAQPFISEYAGGGGFEPTYWLLQHGANPDNDSADPKYKTTINAIFWYPSKPAYVEWQRKCQQWLLERGYKRPPMPDHIRDMRRSFGFPTEEKDIPLL